MIGPFNPVGVVVGTSIRSRAILTREQSFVQEQGKVNPRAPSRKAQIDRLASKHENHASEEAMHRFFAE